ncbi:hypothetical protein AUP44_03820 [Tistrella mobilis]|uniref:Uncharacterized protein n=1 Tax=Tistrella mobilis TaxID=171437 RepID=A0A162L681_9PROT|nr:hypothetical protein AUP44_03820 [Tistrella mobilis]
MIGAGERPQTDLQLSPAPDKHSGCSDGRGHVQLCQQTFMSMIRTVQTTPSSATNDRRPAFSADPQLCHVPAEGETFGHRIQNAGYTMCSTISITCYVTVQQKVSCL